MRLQIGICGEHAAETGMRNRKVIFAILMVASVFTVADRGVCADEGQKEKILIFTKSSGFQHPIIKRYDKPHSVGELILSEIADKLGFEPVLTKEGSEITAEKLAGYKAVVFYTSGDLCTIAKPSKDGMEDRGSVVAPEGKKALLDAIKNGLGFIGIHSAADTWHTVDEKEGRYVSHGDKLDPYLQMLGAEFIAHDKHQPGTFRITDPTFPGMAYTSEVGSQEKGEWYSLKDFAPDMRVLMVLETTGLEGPHYERGPFPITWIRQEGQGRVFYTALGHGRESWDDPAFRSLLSGAMQWVTKKADADLSPNLDAVAPSHGDLPKLPQKEKPAATN